MFYENVGYMHACILHVLSVRLTRGVFDCTPKNSEIRVIYVRFIRG